MDAGGINHLLHDHVLDFQTFPFYHLRIQKHIIDSAINLPISLTRIIRAFLIEEQKIVVRVLKAQQAAEKAAASAETGGKKKKKAAKK